jgi:hypothetical protein
VIGVASESETERTKRQLRKLAEEMDEHLAAVREHVAEHHGDPAGGGVQGDGPGGPDKDDEDDEDDDPEGAPEP